MHFIQNKILVLFILFYGYINCKAQVNIIPYPASVDMMHGTFNLSSNTSIVLVDDKLKMNAIEVQQFNDWIQAHYGFKLILSNTIKNKQNVIFVSSENIESEKYELNIQGPKIAIKASGEGLKNAFESIKQLMQANKKENTFILPSCFIVDSAVFDWRGMHLDVSRHFFDKAFVKKYIDYISLHKMNVFHWHLTDDQGWRIEIKKYPKLTEIGAWRKGSMIGPYSQHEFDTLKHGGFYKQDDIKEIVAYAKLKHVTIVPEIEMPGHAMAALAAYPQFACNAGPFIVEKQWGVFDDVFCPKLETFNFIEDVLTEIIALFPGEYVHIGGDECPKTRWKSCQNCQQLIKKEGLKDEHELQSYFIQRVEKFLNKNNKKLIGWDEILEGGLAPNAAVMSWRGIDGGIAAAKQHHYVVMTPGTHCYFDHYQGSSTVEPLSIGGYTPLEKVYAYNPIPDTLNEVESNYILGAQANVWTEYITTSAIVEYFALPRMAALAEALWTPQENKDLTRFLRTIQKHFNYLDLYKTNYAKSIYNINNEIKKDSVSGVFYLKLSNVLFENNATLAGDSIILMNEKLMPIYYLQPMVLSATFNGYAQYKRNNNFIGKACPIKFNFNKATGKSITFATAPSKYYSKGNLTDGVIAHFPRINNEWLAWSGENMEAILNIGSMQTLQNIDVGFLENQSDWIYLPTKVEIFTSADGIKFDLLSSTPLVTAQNGRNNYYYDFKNTKTQYIKIIATCAPKIETGKPGVSENAWLFADEIEIH